MLGTLPSKDVFRNAFTNAAGIIPPDWYQDFLENKHDYYRSYSIPKRELAAKLAKGYKLPYPRNRIPEECKDQWRTITAPVDILKQAQHELVAKLYKRRPSPFDCCVKGKSRFDAMRVVAGKRVIIGADIRNAFPSTKIGMVKTALQTHGFTMQESEIISQIGTFRDCLPQGSPCSPVLLNLVRKRLDYRLAGYVEKHWEGVMSVYVDNYFFGSNRRDFNKAIPIIKNIAKSSWYELPDKKIHIMRKGSRQQGLGLVASQVGSNKIVQPNKKYRKRLQGILNNGVKRKEAGGDPWPDLTPSVVRGMVECFHGSIYYDRFREMINKIEGREPDIEDNPYEEEGYDDYDEYLDDEF